MKILFIGGTGTISTSISKLLIQKGHELYLINRGNKNTEVSGAKFLIGDVHDEDGTSKLVKDLSFDVVVDFIAFVPADLERDYRLFNGKTKQFIFISSASAFDKSSPFINESTPLENPFWQYSRSKIDCEKYLFQLYKEKNFPITVVRPSWTYCERSVPISVSGRKSSWQVLKRMLDGKRVIIQGDGTAVWTMTHSRDFAKAFVGLLGNSAAIGESVNIMSDETLTWNQIYAAIAAALNVPLKPYHVSSDFLSAVGKAYDFTGGLLGDKANSVIFDTSKIKRLVPGFAATIPFAEGIKETVEYVLAHTERQIVDEEFDQWCDKVIAILDKAALEFK